MKKTLLALAIFAGVAQAADTTTLYGRVGYGVELNKDKMHGKDTKADLELDALRIGIKGKEDVVDGLDAIYQIELGFSLNKDAADIKFDEGNNVESIKPKKDHGIKEIRQAWVGLQGENFGTLKFGKQSSIYGSFTGSADMFKAVSGTFRNATRLGKAISYVTPSVSGLTIGLSGVLDGKHEVIKKGEKDNFNAYEAGAKFAWNGVDVGVVYRNVDAGKDSNTKKSKSDERIAAAAGYSNDMGEFGFDYQHDSKTSDIYALSGAFKHGKNTIRVGGEYLDPKESAKSEKNQEMYNILAGYEFRLTPRTVSWIEGKYTHRKDAKDYGQKKSTYIANVGIRHDF